MVVRKATSAAQALCLLHDAADRRAPIEIALCDRDIPDHGGEQLARRIRAEPQFAQLGIVMLTSSGLRGDAAAASAAGVDAYLPKPVDANTLIECLRALHRPGRHSGPLITTHSLADHRPAPLRILLVDDNAVNLRLATIMLERAGHRIVAASGGADAVAAVGTGAFDLVLMDVQMPEVDGLEATRRIRSLSDPWRASVPIVAVTANAMSADAGACVAAGMDGHLAKPFDRAGLLGAVARWGRLAA
jgi:two-component system sensor histidine kinase/response regulator